MLFIAYLIQSIDSDFHLLGSRPESWTVYDSTPSPKATPQGLIVRISADIS